MTKQSSGIGYYSLLPYVLTNASRVLATEEYYELLKSINPDILAQYSQEREYWESLYSTLLGKVQSTIYNAFLKGNKISTGTASGSHRHDHFYTCVVFLSPSQPTFLLRPEAHPFLVQSKAFPFQPSQTDISQYEVLVNYLPNKFPRTTLL